MSMSIGLPIFGGSIWIFYFELEITLAWKKVPMKPYFENRERCVKKREGLYKQGVMSFISY